MSIKDVGRQLLGTLAPLVGTAIGGPFGGVAGKMLADALGVPPNKLSGVLENPSPEQVEQIKKAELEFAKFMEEAGIKREELAAKDRQSARDMAISTSLRPQITLALIYTGGYFGVMLGLMTNSLVIPEGNEQLMAGLIGVLTAGQVKVLDFFLGSSAGSKMKFSNPAIYRGD